MKSRNIIALALMITMVALVAAPPPASASLIGITVALVIAFAGTVAVTQTVRHENAHNAAETQQAAEKENRDKSEVAVVTP